MLRLSASKICFILDQELLNRWGEEEKEMIVSLFPFMKVRMHLSPMPKPVPCHLLCKDQKSS